MLKRSSRTPTGEAKRLPVSTKITPELRALLQTSAEAQGRTLGAEIEQRLLASFAVEDNLRSLVREEMQAAIAADREAQRVEVMKRATSDGRGGWVASNRDLSQLEALAETAPERTTGYLREALKDPAVKAAMHQRYELGGQPGVDRLNVMPEAHGYKPL